MNLKEFINAPKVDAMKPQGVIGMPSTGGVLYICHENNFRNLYDPIFLKTRKNLHRKRSKYDKKIQRSY